LNAAALESRGQAQGERFMSDNNISILDGSTFLVSSPNGDIDASPDQPHGFFFKDMRHLSKWKLTIQGIPLDVLSADATEYYYAQHFCVPPTGTIYKNPTISIVRRRFVGNGFVENLTVLNHGVEPKEVELRLDVDADFADLVTSRAMDMIRLQAELRRLAEKWKPVLHFASEELLTHPFSRWRVLQKGWPHLHKLRGTVAAECNRLFSDHAVRSALNGTLLYSGLHEETMPVSNDTGPCRHINGGVVPAGGRNGESA
jgi:N-terminal domain of (some) glycogen debranching enzymes